jgi:chemotaxis protein MotB
VIYVRPHASDDVDLTPTLLDLGWESEDRDDTWLVSFADIISTTLAMVVLLFGRATLAPPEATAPLEPPAAIAAAPEPTPAPAVREPIVNRLALEEPPSVLASAAAVPTPPVTDEPTPEHRLASLVTARFAGRITAEQRQQGVVLTIPEVALFDSARAALHSSAMPLLMELAATLREVGEAQISVEGHTDDRPVLGGEFRSNWDLASARANAVTQFLLGQGFAPQRLHSVSYADTHPVADNGSAQGRAANRRVELAVEFAPTQP